MFVSYFCKRNGKEKEIAEEGGQEDDSETGRCLQLSQVQLSQVLQVYNVTVRESDEAVEIKRSTRVASSVRFVKLTFPCQWEVLRCSSFQRVVLTAPVDIYARWIDELEKVNASPYGNDDEAEDSEHESDGYSFVSLQTDQFSFPFCFFSSSSINFIRFFAVSGSFSTPSPTRYIEAIYALNIRPSPTFLIAASDPSDAACVYTSKAFFRSFSCPSPL